jgi:16S rRNA (uracil1498-N3)-methyltransferase
MSAHRFFLEAAAPRERGVLALSEADLHHAVDVLRLRIGEEVEVVEPGGRVLRARVSEVSKRGVRAEVLGEAERRDDLPRVVLVQGVAKGDKMDDIVRQAVEVGAESIVPILTARAVVKLDGAKGRDRGERWRRIARAAAKQAKRVTVPEVRDPVRLKDFAETIAEFDATIVLWEETREPRLGEVVSQLAGAAAAELRVALVVGPEGGFAPEEVSALEEAGAVCATLGPTILRTETAAVVAVALTIDALSRAREGA